MHKLGFYIELSTVQYLREALKQVKPPTIVFHRGDRSLLQEIRRGLAPDAFIIGRRFLPTGEQDALLDCPDPAAAGRAFAEEIIYWDYPYATYKEGNRPLIDAWMGLNESLRGPNSFVGLKVDDQFRRRAAALDRFQVAFRERLVTEGLEAVAFNFAAGNYTAPGHYLEWFPRTLQTYTYLGFHEYGWPSLIRQPGNNTGALYYRDCMAEINRRYKDRHKVIITEAGLARGYTVRDSDDVGWLYPPDSVSEGDYWESLKWYQAELCKDPYVLGACLYEVGHAGGRWESFRHLGKDNQGKAIQLMDKIAQLSCTTEPPPPVASLCQRVRAVKIVLAPVAQIPDDLPAQITQLVQLLTPPPQPGVRISAATQVSDLLTRVGSLEAAWPGYSARPGVTAAEAAATRQALATLRSDLEKVKATANTVTIAATQADDLRAALSALAADARSLAPAIQKAKARWKTALELEAQACGKPQPVLQDLRGKLPQHPTLRYPTRATAQIKRVLVHHTVTAPDIAPDRIAQSQVNSGKAGITYHFLIAGNGTIYWTQPLEAITDQTLQPAINAEAVGVALAGNFTSVVPSNEQITAAGQLIAWLLNTLTLPIGAVAGRSEFDKTVGSPGAQWMSGAKYRDQLLEAVKKGSG